MKIKQEISSAKLPAYQSILQLARKHKAEGLCQKAEDLYKQAIVIVRAESDIEKSILIDTLYELATYFSFQGKDTQAKPLWQEIKMYSEINLSPDNPIYAQTVLHLAEIQEKQGNAEEAEALYKELVYAQEVKLGDESLEICPSMDQLASYYCRQKKYPSAEGLYLRILVIKEFHLGTCSVEINYTVDSLINIFQKLSKWRLAEYMLNRQKAILLALHGEESLCVASCALRLADLQENHTKRFDQAIENLSFALDIIKNRFGDQIVQIKSLQNKLHKMQFAQMEKENNSHNIIASDETITIELPPAQISQNEFEEKSPIKLTEQMQATLAAFMPSFIAI